VLIGDCMFPLLGGNPIAVKWRERCFNRNDTAVRHVDELSHSIPKEAKLAAVGSIIDRGRIALIG
jgi:hypothetical protein